MSKIEKQYFFQNGHTLEEAIRDYINQGYFKQNIARATGLSSLTIGIYAQKYGIKLPKYNHKPKNIYFSLYKTRRFVKC